MGRPQVTTKSIDAGRRIPGRGWTVTETVCTAYINPKVVDKLASSMANAILDSAYGEGRMRKFFRLVEQDKAFNLMKDVFDESQVQSPITDPR